eukprot:gene25243-biopygen9010
MEATFVGGSASRGVRGSTGLVVLMRYSEREWAGEGEDLPWRGRVRQREELHDALRHDLPVFKRPRLIVRIFRKMCQKSSFWAYGGGNLSTGLPKIQKKSLELARPKNCTFGRKGIGELWKLVTQNSGSGFLAQDLGAPLQASWHRTIGLQ